MKPRITIGEQPIDPAEALTTLEQLGGGAVASFTGLVRGDNGLVRMTLEHYRAMTEMQVARIVDEAQTRWPLLGVIVQHRTGPMVPGERIVFVGTASRHRAAALAACDFLIDWLKSDAPFWKREDYADGRVAWVEPRDSDAQSLTRWRQQ